jgi:hypothetical protein
MTDFLANIATEVISQIARHSAQLQCVLETLEREWFPKPPPPYIVMAAFAETITNGSITASDLKLLLFDIEALVSAGGAKAELAAAGLLEALLGRASAGQFNFATVVGLLGPESLKYCLAWDQFTGCTIVADAQSGRGQY